MIVGAAALTHTPLADRIRAPAETERAFHAAVERAAQRVASWKPDLAVVFFPDHFNGFHYDLMPAFCIGIQGDSIGDWGTIPGPIDIPEDRALDCAGACLTAGIDVAVSYRIRADHGYAQVVEYLSTVTALNLTVPVFINCAAPPLPRLGRCRTLGATIGAWAQRLDARVVMLASGGLSHDPPTPTIADATPEVRQRLIQGGLPTHSERFKRQQRVTRASQAFFRGEGNLRELNPGWDESFLEHLRQGRLEFSEQLTDEELSCLAGCGAHEIRTWLAAWSAAGVDSKLDTTVLFSQPIREWITSCAVAVAEVRT